MKKVVIIGASTGIGYAVAEALASRGIKVGVAARRTDSLKALKEKYPGFVEYMSIDVTSADAPDKILSLIALLGGMDIYFHVAGILDENLYLDPEREVRTVNTNASGFAASLSTAYRYFRNSRRKGQIAAVTSVAGTKGIGRLAAYSASKSFCQQYMVALEQLANAEEADITFTDIRPGWIKTPLVDSERVYPMEMTVDYVLPQIIKAIVRKKRVAVIDWRWNLLVGAWRLLPDALWVRMKMSISTPEPPLPTVSQQIEEARKWRAQHV
ncbi:MAG: SDR family NAD(P)-dependent oxidoreductase [Muribaculaceae bacterium]|nr:SDR family NAD(P)-dependent oxidoreductase [Muribaculaceae bacterium]MDE6753107.1 SDR family NAD(P)-dependent oxidoreductase [Muribaculaceae bacterium]